MARVDAGHLLLRAGGLPLRAYPCVETPRSRPEPSSPSSLPWSSLPFPGSLSLAVPHLTGPRRRYRRAPPRLSPPPRPLERSRSSAMTCSSSSLRQTTRSAPQRRHRCCLRPLHRQPSSSIRSNPTAPDLADDAIGRAVSTRIVSPFSPGRARSLRCSPAMAEPSPPPHSSPVMLR